MQTKTVFIVFIVLLTCSCFAQEDDKTTKLNKFVQMLERYRKETFEEYSKILSNIDDKTLREETKIIYEAIEAAPNEARKIVENDNIRAEKVYEERRKNKLPLVTVVRYVSIYNNLIGKIRDDYGPLVSAAVISPIILRAKVLSFQKTDDYLEFPGRQLNRKLLKLSVEEIFKGKVDFAKQKEMEVFYRDWNETPAEDFKVGASYLFYLCVEKADDKYPFAVNMTIDSRGSRFLISEEKGSVNMRRDRLSPEEIWKQRKRDLLGTIDSIINMSEIIIER